MESRIEFDEKLLLAKVAKASIDVLRRMGAYVRKVARSKVKISPEASPPGTPPNSRNGLLKRAILFGVEKRKQSVVIGPSEAIIGTAQSAHEFGGAYKNERYPKRPLMGPSLKESVPHLTKFWQDAVK